MFIATDLLLSGALLARLLIFIVSGEAAAFSMDQYVGNHTTPNRRTLLISLQQNRLVSNLGYTW